MLSCICRMHVYMYASNGIIECIATHLHVYVAMLYVIRMHHIITLQFIGS